MGRGGFSFADADEIFRRAFGGRDPFEDFFGDNDDDFFGQGFFGKPQKKGGQRQVGGFGMMGGFDDDFFGGGFGSMGGFSSQFSSSNGGMSGGTSIKTSTVIENGRKVTRTEKTTVDNSGRRVTEVTEKTDDGRGNVN